MKAITEQWQTGKHFSFIFLENANFTLSRGYFPFASNNLLLYAFAYKAIPCPSPIDPPPFCQPLSRQKVSSQTWGTPGCLLALGRCPQEPHFQLFLGSMGEKDTKRMENSKGIRMELTLPSFHSKDGKFKWHKK